MSSSSRARTGRRLAPDALFQLRPTGRQTAKGPDTTLVIDLHGQLRTATAHARDRRAGADRIRPAAGRCGTHSPRNFRRKRASMPGRAPARAAGSPTPTTFRCRHSTCTWSTAISASDRCWDWKTAADFSFPIPGSGPTASIALLDYYGAADKKLAVLAPSTIWETKEWRSDGFAEVAPAVAAKRLCRDVIGAGRERDVCEKSRNLLPAW